jgi:hypothetical protein
MRVYQFRHLGFFTSHFFCQCFTRRFAFALFRVQQQRNEIMHTFFEVCKSCGIFFTFFGGEGRLRLSI